MSKRLEKLLRREKFFVELAMQGELYCFRHQEYLSPFQVLDKHCYSGKHGRKACKYVQARGR